MSRAQINLVWVTLGTLLFSIALFRNEWFQQQEASLYIFMALLTVGLVLIAAGLFQLLGFRWWHGLTALVAFELALFLFFQSVATYQVRRVPGKVREYLKLVYERGFMNSIQFDRSVSYFDSQLQYLLKPGSHKFNNLEFNSTVEVNSAGFRDFEEAVIAPKVLFLGDSYTMGWGVESEKSYVKLFEKKAKVTCLNAGISSYGTAREYMLLRRINLDSCHLVFIQYCSNDLVENYMFSRNKGSLAPEQAMLEGYNKYTRINILLKNYYPFKHVYWLFKGGIMYSGLADRLARLQQPQAAETESVGNDHGAYLSRVLEDIRTHFKGEIVFYQMDTSYPEEMTEQLRKACSREDLKIHWLDMSKAGLEETDYYLLDPHINETGHKKVADALFNFVKGRGLWPLSI